MNLTGQIAPDGSFQLTQPSNTGFTLNGDFVEVVVTGKVPQAGAAGWSGTYSLTTAAGSTGCLVNETGSFTAAAFTAVNGTYTGPLIAANTGTTGVNLSPTLSQGSPAEYQFNPLITSYYLPLTGTASVSGIPCFMHGSIAAPSAANTPGEVAGNMAVMIFLMDDGSHLLLTGIFSDLQVTNFNLTSAAVIGGQCSGFFSGTLIRQ